ncbi:hypothetical protein [Actinomadura parmotrematis]|uniref:PRC-barrel domain containing protein n=1 Tax=Actinomadura parmotrematis TaxID=2864039 RepID=A0ABS7G2C1_9ACTN|nr:hypothetical protein [Actinomadura parmotrematis]MBW8486860.1 hypothetical protein [Actinomadura parmotrematis]
MRLADLIDALVLDGAGDLAGRVTDVRLVETADGLVVDGLVVSPKRRGRLLAWDHRPVERPRILGAIARAGSRRARWVPWDAVASHEPPGRLGDLGTVRLDRASADLVPLADAQREWA